MAEIDTKSIESVQATISYFGEIGDHQKDHGQRKMRFISKDPSHGLDEGKEIDSLMKELADLKDELESKNAAHKQALLKLDHYQKTADEVSIQLKNSEIEKEAHCKESRIRLGELELVIEKMANQSSESKNLCEQLSHVLRELKDTQGQVLQLGIELSAAKEANFESMKKAEALESSLTLERLKTEELLRHVKELNETIMDLKMNAAEEEKEKIVMITEKEVQIELAEETASEAREQLRLAREQLEMMQCLEKSALQKDLQKANSLHKASEKVAFDALSELNQLKADLRLKEKQNSDQAACISLLETELNQLRLELRKANKEKDTLMRNADAREDAAAAEAAEQRDEIEKSAVYAAEENQSSLSKTGNEEAENKNCEAQVRISKQESEGGGNKVLNPGQGSILESDKLKKELDIAKSKIAELRARAEQAISRAEVAESGKAELEEQIKKWKEHKAKRKAALAALNEASVLKENAAEASVSKDTNTYRYGSEQVHQSLSKMLNIKV